MYIIIQSILTFYIVISKDVNFRIHSSNINSFDSIPSRGY